MKYLSLVGGEDAGATVRRMMKKIGTNNLWSHYNMEAKNAEKRRFKSTQIFKVIKGMSNVIV